MTLRVDVLEEQWTGLPSSLCASCRHLDVLRLSLRRCSAFPDGIPGPIWDGTVEHRQPYPGDRGVQYAARRPGDVERLAAERRRVVDAARQRVVERRSAS
jgi:hypothetical protein